MVGRTLIVVMGVWAAVIRGAMIIVMGVRAVVIRGAMIIVMGVRAVVIERTIIIVMGMAAFGGHIVRTTIIHDFCKQKIILN